MDNDRARQLALILQAVDDLEMELAEYRTEYKERMTTLVNEAAKLKRDILSGQMTITEVLDANNNGKENSKIVESGAGEPEQNSSPVSENPA